MYPAAVSSVWNIVIMSAAGTVAVNVIVAS